MANQCSNQCSCRDCEKLGFGELVTMGVVAVGTFFTLCYSLAQMMSDKVDAEREKNTAEHQIEKEKLLDSANALIQQNEVQQEAIRKELEAQISELQERLNAVQQ
jgi:hypothetical protein